MRETTIRVSATKRMEQGFHHRRMELCSSIGGWSSVLPSEDGKVFLPAPSEHRTTFPLRNWWMATVFFLLRDGTRFPLHYQRMEHGSIPLPRWRMEQGFHATLEVWATQPSKDGKQCLLLHIRIGQVFAPLPAIGRHFRTGASAIEEWNRVSTSEDGMEFLRRHWRMEEYYLHSANDGTRF
jgi:hypothetical protein